MRAAYSMLAQDTTTLRGALGRARLDTVQLGATVEALATETGRLRAELVHARAESAALRAQPVAPDPLVLLFATQAGELRGQLAENQRTVTELTSRLAELLAVQLQSARAAAPPELPVPALLRPSARSEADPADAGRARPPITDLRDPATGTANDRLRLIRRALDG